MKDGLPTLPIAQVLARYLHKAGLEGALLQRQAWERAAGEHLARHVVPVDRKDGVLVLVADAVEWQRQAVEMEARLLPRLHAEGLDVHTLRIDLSPEAPRGRRLRTVKP